MKRTLLAGMLLTLALVGGSTKGEPDLPVTKSEPEPPIKILENVRHIYIEPIPPPINQGDHPFTQRDVILLR
jgi:hypothetical protein